MTAWSWWQEKLAGKPVQMNPDNPQAGFYRMPYKQEYGARRTFQPVAYWPGENGELNCRIGDRDIIPAYGRALWQSVGNHPVTEEAYRRVAEAGGLWPDEHELVPMGRDNQPPEDTSFEGLRDAIEDLSREAKERIEGPAIADQDEANRIANLADRLAELHKMAEEARKIEKRPYDDAAKQVQLKWAPLLLAAEAYRNLKYKLLTPWLKRKELEAKERAEKQAVGNGTLPLAAERPQAGTRGRAMSLKTTKRAEITDYAAALNFFSDSPDVKATVQSLADRAVRAGIVVPGTKVIEEQNTV